MKNKLKFTEKDLKIKIDQDAVHEICSILQFESVSGFLKVISRQGDFQKKMMSTIVKSVFLVFLVYRNHLECMRW